MGDPLYYAYFKINQKNIKNSVDILRINLYNDIRWREQQKKIGSRKRIECDMFARSELYEGARNE